MYEEPVFQRCLELKRWVQERSYFLFGPRQTGKSTLLRQLFPEAEVYNLNQSDTYRELTRRPEVIRKRLTRRDRVVIIDEIQLFPELLNEIQATIDSNPKVRFVLTGSSQRSLRAKGVNLLGGRARTAHLFPLVSAECGDEWFDARIRYGGLPGVLKSEDPVSELHAYTGLYLREEVRAEGAVRTIEAFSRFLDVAGLCNGTVINFSKIGDDAAVPARTVHEYFQVLEDTLVGFQVRPYRGGKKRKAVTAAKFYFFDLGVTHSLMETFSFVPGTEQYGEALEHLIALELRAWMSYRRIPGELEYWRTLTRQEVDFVVGGRWAIEVKGARRISQRDLRGLRQIADEANFERRVLVCLEERGWREDDGIEVMSVSEFLRDLWSASGKPRKKPRTRAAA